MSKPLPTVEADFTAKFPGPEHNDVGTSQSSEMWSKGTADAKQLDWLFTYRGVGYGGVTMHGFRKIVSNQKAIYDSIANIDGAANALRAQQAAQEAERMASLCAESASRAGTAQEITAAAAPVLEELKAIRVELEQLKQKVDQKPVATCNCVVS